MNKVAESIKNVFTYIIAGISSFVILPVVLAMLVFSLGDVKKMLVDANEDVWFLKRDYYINFSLGTTRKMLMDTNRNY